KSGITGADGKVTLKGIPAGGRSSVVFAIHKNQKSSGSTDVEVKAGETVEATISITDIHEPEEETADVSVQVLDSVTRKGVDTATIRVADNVVEETSLTTLEVPVGQQPYKVSAP